MTRKIRVLLLAANPFDGAHLRLDHEARAIHEAIRLGNEREALDFRTAWAVRTGDLQTALNEHQPHVVHFAGHASARDGIYLEDDGGSPKPVSKEALAGLFRVFSTSIRLVVLNACHSQSTTDAFHEIIDYTVGMQRLISDEAAILFSSALYGALASGSSVKDAFALGVNRLLIEGSSESETPAFYAKFGVDVRQPFATVDKVHASPVAVQDVKVKMINTRTLRVGNVSVKDGSRADIPHSARQTIDLGDVRADTVDFTNVRHGDVRSGE
ncbi:MAG: hypothetical protein JWM95_4277 [Gemmatimonadetes bacterium]|nr:hypothetical protein [Gemmatimonadota bacterium]